MHFCLIVVLFTYCFINIHSTIIPSSWHQLGGMFAGARSILCHLRQQQAQHDGWEPVVDCRGHGWRQNGRLEELRHQRRRISQKYVSFVVKNDEMNPAHLLFAAPLALRWSITHARGLGCARRWLEPSPMANRVLTVAQRSWSSCDAPRGCRWSWGGWTPTPMMAGVTKAPMGVW